MALSKPPLPVSFQFSPEYRHTWRNHPCHSRYWRTVPPEVDNNRRTYLQPYFWSRIVPGRLSSFVWLAIVVFGFTQGWVLTMCGRLARCSIVESQLYVSISIPSGGSVYDAITTPPSMAPHCMTSHTCNPTTRPHFGRCWGAFEGRCLDSGNGRCQRVS